MSDRCEPPEGLRDRDGWHWVQFGSDTPELQQWSRRMKNWYALVMKLPEWRYLAPTPTPDTVRALVEALEAFCTQGENVVENIRAGQVNVYHLGLGGLEQRIEHARAAIARAKAEGL